MYLNKDQSYRGGVFPSTVLYKMISHKMFLIVVFSVKPYFHGEITGGAQSSILSIWKCSNPFLVVMASFARSFSV